MNIPRYIRAGVKKPKQTKISAMKSIVIEYPNEKTQRCDEIN